MAEIKMTATLKARPICQCNYFFEKVELIRGDT